MKRLYLITNLFLLFLLAACSNGSAPIGDPCKEKTMCESRFCIFETVRDEPTGWSGGYCSAQCQTDADCQTSAENYGLCYPVGEGALCLAPCNARQPCREGYICATERSLCLPDCRNGFDCGMGRVCHESGVCIAAGTLPPGDTDYTEEIPKNRMTGEECVWNIDCLSAYCIPELDIAGAPTGWSGGYCSKPCSNLADCYAGDKCAALGDGSFCLKACSNEADCRQGYFCEPSWGVCLPDCRNGWDCGADLECKETGLCGIPGLDPKDERSKPTGYPCEYNIECVSEFCIPEFEEDGSTTYWPLGYCSKLCDDSLDCVLGTSCWPLGDKSYCFYNCTKTPDCRLGYICDRAWQVCLPDCRNGWHCGEKLVCSPEGSCLPPPNSCVPNCAGKECGYDGCGGTCGFCSAGKMCNRRGECVSSGPGPGGGGGGG